MATSKAYQLSETEITFKASAGTVAFTPTSLAASNGRQSAQHDFGTSARAYMFNWTAYVKFATTPVVGEVIEIWGKTSDGTHIDNDDGTGDIAVSSADKLKNLTPIGRIVVDEANATPEFSASGRVQLSRRYFNVVFWNATADALSATAADHGFILEPTVVQGQAT